MTCRGCKKTDGTVDERTFELLWEEIRVSITAPLCPDCHLELPVKLKDGLASPTAKAAFRIMGVALKSYGFA
jgi:hypothetical protein